MGDHSSHQSGEDAVGLRISIFCSEGFDPSLEGIITSFDHETGHHGILFDTGVQLDIDISKERVMLERPPLKERTDDLGDDVLPLSSAPHHFPHELYRHSQDLKAEHQVMMDRMPRHSGSSSFSGYPQLGRDRGMSNSSTSYSRDSSADLYADAEAMMRSSFSSFSGQQRARRREEIIGLRITIYNNEPAEGTGQQMLEGVVVSFDDVTCHHGILFDSGVQLDVDLHEERVKLSRNRAASAPGPATRPSLGPAPGPASAEVEEERRAVTSKLRQWIVANTKDITQQAALSYATMLYDANVPSIPKLIKKLHKDASFLRLIGVDEDDLEEVMAALKREDPTLPAYSSVLEVPVSSNATSLSHLFAAMSAQGSLAGSHGTESESILPSAIAALTGVDPIPTSSTT